MPYALQTYAGDDVSTFYPVAFPYLARQQVRLYYDLDLQTGAYAQALASGADYEWTNSTTLELTVPVPSGTTLTIVRETPLDQLLVQWTDASNMTEEALNTAQLQWLYLLQVVVDRGGVAPGGGGGNVIDIIDSLTSTRTDAALSANQGRVLRDLIGAGGGVQIINALNSTSVTAALSANMGRTLDLKIQAVAADLANYRLETDIRLDAIETGLQAPGSGLGDPEFAPIGAIRWQVCGSPPLEGWLEAEGQEKLRSVYGPLFNVIGTQYGAGNGSTTFRFPDRADVDPTSEISANYCPYIKFGSRFASTVTTFSAKEPGLYGGFSIDELAGTLSDRTIDPATSTLNFLYMSASGVALAASSVRSGSSRIVALRAAQQLWSEVVVENQGSYIDIERVFMTRDGSWLLATSTNALEPWRAWEWTGSQYSLRQEGWAAAADFNGSRDLLVASASHSGNYILFGSYFPDVYLYKLTNGAWGEVSQVPAGIGDSNARDGFDWHPSDEWVVHTSRHDATCIEVLRRVGDNLESFALHSIDAVEIAGQLDGISPPRFSDDGTRVVVAWIDSSYAGVEVFDFNPTTGALAEFVVIKNPRANVAPFDTPLFASFLPGKTDQLFIADLGASNRAFTFEFNGNGIVGSESQLDVTGATELPNVGDLEVLDSYVATYSDEF